MPVLSPRHQALGQAIRQLRTEQAMTQDSLADRAGMTANYVGDTERGERNISVRALWQIADALGILTSDLLRAADEHARER
jgi:XRE family transcriptional regulator, regulator of sulfur utilization